MKLRLLVTLLTVLLAGPAFGGGAPPFVVNAKDKAVTVTEGQGKQWRHKINFHVLNREPKVCGVEYTVQTRLDVAGPNTGVCMPAEGIFDIHWESTTLSDNNCVFEVGQRRIRNGKCSVPFRADCELQFSDFEKMPPIRLFTEDEAVDGNHLITIKPRKVNVNWRTCKGNKKTNGSSDPGSVNVSFK